MEAYAQAIGISSGRRKTKIHAVAGARCKPLTFALILGEAVDYLAAEALLDHPLARCTVRVGTR